MEVENQENGNNPIRYGSKVNRKAYELLTDVYGAFSSVKNSMKIAARAYIEEAIMNGMMLAEGYEQASLGEVIGKNWENLSVFSDKMEEIVNAEHDSGRRCLITVRPASGEPKTTHYDIDKLVYLKGHIDADGEDA